ncbi:MAG: CoA transferase [Aigarchaeota archaeon]|nr:CoA transferase [Candidatus Pelearchaeum maunauluense]
MRPLSRVRVLDLTNMPPWSYATLLLAELGAEVIKIEQPGVGDTTRKLAIRGDVSILHLIVNRGKKSIAINLKSKAGRDIFYRLCQVSDIVIIGFNPSTTRRLGIDYESIRKLNERIIYCSISAFGYGGKYSGLSAHDINIMALTGALGMMKQENGRPIVPGVLLADFATALTAVLGILSALLERQVSGRGKQLDITMFESVFPFISLFIAEYLASGKVPRGGEHVLMGGLPCYNVYETKDGRYITLGMPLEPHIWEKFCKTVGREDLIEKQYDSKATEELRQLFRTKSLEEWVEILYSKVECFAPVLELDEALKSELVAERDIVFSKDYPNLGPVTILSTPSCIRSEEITAHAPELGEHTEEVLRMLGMGNEEITALKREGAIM